jgi:hypothetical protein
MLETKKIVRVRFIPPNKQSNKLGNEEGVWQGLQDNGEVATVREDTLLEQFGQQFVSEVKRLGRLKFVDIPVGTTWHSLMEIMTQLKVPGAPEVRFMQGEKDTCVFSSFASALHSAGIPKLRVLANKIHKVAEEHIGIFGVLASLKQVVHNYERGLQPIKMKKNFHWNSYLADNEFFVGVIRDSSGSVQHAVSIYRRWIFDSNEPYALPLTKQNLDYCTWGVDPNGDVKEFSTFVKFERGITFNWHKGVLFLNDL